MQIAAIIKKAEITRTKPPIVSKCLCGLVGKIEIAREHPRPARQNLACVVAVVHAAGCRFLINAQLDFRNRVAGSFETKVARLVDGEERRRFGETVSGGDQPPSPSSRQPTSALRAAPPDALPRTCASSHDHACGSGGRRRPRPSAAAAASCLPVRCWNADAALAGPAPGDPERVYRPAGSRGPASGGGRPS